MKYFTAALLILAMGPTIRADAPRGDSSMEKVVQGNNQFAFDLYAKLRQQPGNLFLSPYSISTALAMTYAGARGETAEQMAATLHFSLPPERLHAAFADLARQINGEGTTGAYQLSVANALWGQEGERFLPEFVRLLEAHYGAGLRQVDFRSGEQARRTINAWVEERTREKIKDLLQPPYPTPDTSLVLTDAIYFKGDWADQFPKRGTGEEDFHVAADQVTRVPMMHRIGHYRHFEGDRLQALETPYKGNDLAMVVLLPQDRGGLAELEASLTEQRLAGWLSRLASRQVQVSFPKYVLEKSFELQDVLSAMGMPAAFGPQADFSGMDGRRELFISAVIHKAFVDVNEEGTEAAAATAVLMPRAAAARPEPVVSFRADHPFIFVIRDNRSGSILFLGRVTHPRG